MPRRFGNRFRHPAAGRAIVLSWFALLLLVLAPAAVSAVSAALKVPALVGRVNDYASMISPQARSAIETKLQALEQSDSTQIAILTVPTLDGEPVEEFSIRVAEAWKIGRKGKDNGILLIVSKGDRKVRVEVGYGLEGRLTDLQAGRIVNDVIKPAFAKGDFDSGFIAASDALVASVKGEYTAPPHKKRDKDAPSIPVVFIILFALFFYFRMFAGRRGGGPSIFGGGPWVGGGFGSGGGGGDGGGFSGGGGGFGGGGASGDW
jgi:uncharacterized protein